MSGERVSIFLSHTWADKAFVRKLARDLDCHGIRYWLDEAEIKFGQSLISKIREGIDEVDYVAVILSPRSVESTWVMYEVDVAMTQEIEGKGVKVIPMMIEKCELRRLSKFCVSGDNQPFRLERIRLCHRLDPNCSTSF